MTELAAEAAAPPAPAKHIVDQLIEERALKLRANPVVWPLVRATIYPLFGYRKAIRMADHIAPMDGRMVMNWSSAFLGMKLDTAGVEHVPESGPSVVIANHPGGISDGIAVWDALIDRRPDLCFFANRDALRVSPGLESLVIPVEWRKSERSREKTRETLKSAAQAFKDGRCVVIFPAGAMAEWSWRKMGLDERAWAPTAVSFARKFDAPITPLGVRARMSFWYYAFDHVSEEIRNMTVFHELLAKKGARYRLRFAPAVAPAALPRDEAEASEILRARCDALAWGT